MEDHPQRTWLISGHRLRDPDSGRKKDFVPTWVEEGFCSVDFREVTGRFPAGTPKEDIRAAVDRDRPDARQKSRDYDTSQLFRFVGEVQSGDRVVTRTDPNGSNEIHVGIVDGSVKPKAKRAPLTRRRRVWWATQGRPLPWASLPESLRKYLLDRRRFTLSDISAKASEIEKLLREADGPAGGDRIPRQGTAFSLTENNSYSRAGLRRYRPDQERFRRAVLARYDHRCPLSGIAVPEMLEAAHLLPDAEGGSADAGNGLLMNAALHAAFDQHLFAIHPEGLDVVVRPNGPSAADMGIIHTRLTAQRLPNRLALQWRYGEWQRRTGS
ncbi:HNH endonuclease [Streptomyces sp. NPDC053513]|uniref:HNH endonuclease n=1 Tax=unclassified Streptomyces TaxID=2593676 RepID=UPI0037CE0992